MYSDIILVVGIFAGILAYMAHDASNEVTRILYTFLALIALVALVFEGNLVATADSLSPGIITTLAWLAYIAIAFEFLMAFIEVLKPSLMIKNGSTIK